MDSPQQLPEAAERRLQSSTFSSSLSINEFAACLHSGLEPVDMVQGFCAMRWSAVNGYGPQQQARYSYSTGYYDSYPYGSFNSFTQLRHYECPGFANTAYGGQSHTRWFGANYALTGLEHDWLAGFSKSLARMVQEAREAGGHGVIGVRDSVRPFVEANMVEYHLTGTAVRVAGRGNKTSNVWSTFLAGQRLDKLFEAGMVPVSVICQPAVVAIQPYCVTEEFEAGRTYRSHPTSCYEENTQVTDALMDVGRRAREKVRREIGGDALYGTTLTVQPEMAYGLSGYWATMKGTRVRRFRDVEPIDPPLPTVTLS